MLALEPPPVVSDEEPLPPELPELPLAPGLGVTLELGLGEDEITAPTRGAGVEDVAVSLLEPGEVHSDKKMNRNNKTPIAISSKSRFFFFLLFDSSCSGVN